MVLPSLALGSWSSSLLQLQLGTPGPTALAEKHPNRPSLFSVEDDFQTPSPEEFKYGASTSTPASPSSKKRPRSMSAQSVQSVRSQLQQRDALSSFSQPQQHDSAVTHVISGLAASPASASPSSSATSSPSWADVCDLTVEYHNPDTTTPQPSQIRAPSTQHSRSCFYVLACRFQPQPESQLQCSRTLSSRSSAIPFSDIRTTPRAVSGFEAYATKPPPCARSSRSTSKRFAGSFTPVDLPGAARVCVTGAHVM